MKSAVGNRWEPQAGADEVFIDLAEPWGCAAETEAYASECRLELSYFFSHLERICHVAPTDPRQPSC